MEGRSGRERGQMENINAEGNGLFDPSMSIRKWGCCGGRRDSRNWAEQWLER